MAINTMKRPPKKGRFDGDIREIINRNAFPIAALIVAGLLGNVWYSQWVHSSDSASVIAKAVDVARNTVGPKLENFEKERRRLPRNNSELELPDRDSVFWSPLTVVDVLPDGSVYFEFYDEESDASKGNPAFVWRFKDSRYGKANSCGAQQVLRAALARNGLDCDERLPALDPAAMIAFATAAKQEDDPQAFQATQRTRLKVKRNKVPADHVIEAIGRDNDKALEKLKSRGVNICLADPQGRLPLAEAARNNQIKTLTALIAAKCDLQQMEPYSQQTALTSALTLRNIDATIALLAGGANPNFPNAAGQVPLLLLGSSADSVTLHLREGLRRRGADIDIRDADGVTLLMRAADRGSLALARWLIKSGAKLDLQDDEGRTALMRAVLSTNGDQIVKALIAAKASLDLRDSGGSTALGLTRVVQDVARQKALAAALSAAGAQF